LLGEGVRRGSVLQSKPRPRKRKERHMLKNKRVFMMVIGYVCGRGRGGALVAS
jgi:hypothetical protein